MNLESIDFHSFCTHILYAGVNKANSVIWCFSNLPVEVSILMDSDSEL